jgi:hypothetical protein
MAFGPGLPTMIVWPSGFWRTKSVIAIVPPPPDLFSTTGRLAPGDLQVLREQAALHIGRTAGRCWDNDPHGFSRTPIGVRSAGEGRCCGECCGSGQAVTARDGHGWASAIPQFQAVVRQSSRDETRRTSRAMRINPWRGYLPPKILNT